VEDVNDAECIDSQQTKECVQDPAFECWDDSNDPSEVIGCDLCTGVVCPSGQEIIDTNTCECGVIPGECGNDICEPAFGENPRLGGIDLRAVKRRLLDGHLPGIDFTYYYRNLEYRQVAFAENIPGAKGKTATFVRITVNPCG